MGQSASAVNYATMFFMLLTVINIVVLGPLAWIVKGLIKDQKDLERSHNDHKFKLPHEYVLKEDYQRDNDEIINMLQRIFDKLDGKADKTSSSG